MNCTVGSWMKEKWPLTLQSLQNQQILRSSACNDWLPRSGKTRRRLSTHLHAAYECKFKSNSTAAICKMTWISLCLKSHYLKWTFFSGYRCCCVYFRPFDFIFDLTIKYRFSGSAELSFMSVFVLALCFFGLRNIMWKSSFDGESTHDSRVVTSLHSVYSERLMKLFDPLFQSHPVSLWEPLCFPLIMMETSLFPLLDVFEF